MSPFEPQDTLMENSTAPTTTNAMACPPPTASGRDNAAAGSTPSSNGAAAVAPAAATDGAPSATPKPQPPQNTERRPTTTACPPAINTTTGLISPLTTLKNSAKSSSSTSSSTSPTPASILKKMTPTTKKKHHNHHHRHVEMTLPNTPQVDSYKISKIGQAREKIKRSFDKSKLLENDEYVFPRFEMEELTLGEVLGQGGFGTVLEIKAMEVVHHTHTPSLSPTTSAEAAINSNEEMERQVFRIDDVHKRKRSHSFRLRRRNHHENHHHHHFGFGGSLKFSNSHDGCEGLGNNHGLASIIERDSMDIPSSRSHDCVEGDVPEAAPSAAAEGDTNSSVPKRELRVKALSWSHAKAKAHDVSQFFHRSPKSGGGDEVQNVETKESHESEGENVTTNNNDEVRPREERKKSISYDSSLLRRGNGAYTPTGGSMHDRYPRRASRNFSFLSWRDSEAGEEGNDAISPEELLKYNIDLSYYSTTQQHNIYETLDTHSEGDEKEDALQDKKQRRGSCPSGQTNEYIVEKEMNNRGRRIILFPSPKKAIPAETPEDEARTAAFYQDKSFITQHATNSEGEARYVIKIISANIVENDFKKFLQAAMDMATETYFLSVLNHPNILKMRAVGQGDMFSPSYFLVLDRLYDTLNDRIEGAWKTQFDHLENSIFVWNRAAKLKALWEERMGVMKDLAGALDYLHELKIIYRDIKPENVGFDSRGNVKLFDFGLAKELHEEDECSNGTYKLTPNTGSIRYMSPENGNKWPYNFMADSYSFGIMLWEVIALERPFASYTPREIRDMVMRWGERPKTREEWPERIVDLMKSAWDSNFRKRPTMKAIEATLEKEMEDSGVW